MKSREEILLDRWYDEAVTSLSYFRAKAAGVDPELLMRIHALTALDMAAAKTAVCILHGELDEIRHELSVFDEALSPVAARRLIALPALAKSLTTLTAGDTRHRQLWLARFALVHGTREHRISETRYYLGSDLVRSVEGLLPWRLKRLTRRLLDVRLVGHDLVYIDWNGLLKTLDMLSNLTRYNGREFDGRELDEVFFNAANDQAAKED